jgi:hypothetical protein
MRRFNRMAALDTPVPFRRRLDDLFSPRGPLVPVLRELPAV